MQFFKTLASGVTSLLFPPICKSCEKRMDSNAGPICPDCWQKLQLFSAEEMKNKNIPENLDLVWPVFLFDDLFQKIIHALKYQGNISIGYEIGQRMALHLPPEVIDFPSALFVPIPLHPIKLRERGYNQSEAIAKGLASNSGIRVETKLLKRIKNTATQTKLNAEERQANMEMAFAINRGNTVPSDSVIILVDDVFTTGATLNSAAGVLRQSGFQKVIAVTAAAPL
ncbi:MAG TPA: ComF family protein [Candidatus Marinimicrobia bacterium]|nr:ComF family protein [Candidatus Neomarinimicrobiota bacterium]HRS52430.1 ComF family protein [Candidatus Neomarinimicrobiota bacterium]HRU92519.1 ComF family protein [Candidatus Neomarinimicrobiota bacterium]